ncbi:hypothetical protein FACS1894200_02220 [Spirochaetia bacterium]|nr:hypothetical protein FACS1894200_02220 [Spirochaetia bacterium]
MAPGAVCPYLFERIMCEVVTMLVIQGYFRNNVFINESDVPIPNDEPVRIISLDKNKTQFKSRKEVEDFFDQVHYPEIDIEHDNSLSQVRDLF